MNLYNIINKEIIFLGKLSNNDIDRILQKINQDNLSMENCWIWCGTIQDKINKGHQHGCIR